MGKQEKLLRKVLEGRSDANIAFKDLHSLYQVRQVRNVILRYQLGELGDA